MKALSKFFASPFWKIFQEKKRENTVSFCVTLALNTVAAFLEGGSFGLILLAFSALNGELPEKAAKFPLLHWLCQGGFSTQRLFVSLILLAILCQVLRSALCYLGQKSITQMSIRCQIAMEKRIYHQIFSLPFSYIHRYKSGDLVEAVQTPAKIHPVLDAVNRALVSTFNMTALIGLLFVISPFMTGALFLLFALIYAIQKVIFKNISEKSALLTKELADFNHYTLQCLNGLKTIFTFNRQRYMRDAVEQKADLIGKMSGRLFLLQFALGPLNEILGILTVGVCVIFAPLFFSDAKEVALPALLTFVTVAYRLVTKLQAGIASIGCLAYHSGFFSHLRSFLEREDKENPKQLRDSFLTFSKQIEFRDVSLRYEGNDNPSISSLSFVLPKGHFLALVGASGAGKSSVADLLIGLYEPEEGGVFIDGIDLTSYDPGSWKERLGVVNQEPFLLNSTVMENICFGCPSATEKKAMQAAQDAHAHEFIERLPLGYQTLLGASGHTLSGGEKQRIALARALLREPEILILDEATSHLDSHSERVIQETMAQLTHKKTLVVIAHRLSSIIHADQILVLEAGRIIERGRHDELVALGKKYAHFWRLQQKDSREQRS